MNITVFLYVAMILAGAFFIFLAVNQYLKAKKAEQSWPTTQGVVLTSEIETYRSHTKNRTTTSYIPKVTYKYQVNAQSYTGDKIGFGKATYGSGKAEKILALYSQGATVTVHYDPSDPAKAVLETRAASFGNYLFLGIILVAAGIIAAWVLGS